MSKSKIINMQTPADDFDILKEYHGILANKNQMELRASAVKYKQLSSASSILAGAAINRLKEICKRGDFLVAIEKIGFEDVRRAQHMMNIAKCFGNDNRFKWAIENEMGYTNLRVMSELMNEEDWKNLDAGAFVRGISDGALRELSSSNLYAHFQKTTAEALNNANKYQNAQRKNRESAKKKTENGDDLSNRLDRLENINAIIASFFAEVKIMHADCAQADAQLTEIFATAEDVAGEHLYVAELAVSKLNSFEADFKKSWDRHFCRMKADQARLLSRVKEYDSSFHPLDIKPAKPRPVDDELVERAVAVGKAKREGKL